jgi:hypothetical protein
MGNNIRKLVFETLVRVYPWWLKTMYKMDIGNGVQISHRAILDRSINPQGIHIGDETMLTRGVVVLAYDYCRSLSIQPQPINTHT